MNTERDRLIRRLVDRKMASATRGKVACVPCLGMRSTNQASRVPVAARSK